jgi:hypothetical protein
MKNACRFIPLLALIALLSSCLDHDLSNPIVSQNGLLLSSAQESPANPSPATGSANVHYDKSTRKLSYTITYSNLTGTPTMGHIHASAPRGSNAGVLIPFTNLPGATSGTITGTADIAPDKEEDLLNGLFYINLHTAQYPGGEIRGQIEFYSQPFIVSKKGLPLDPAQAEQTKEPLAIGSMDVSYNKRTKRLSYYITWDNTPFLLTIVIGGPAPRGSLGSDKQAIAPIGLPTSPKAFSGSILIDEVTLKESELLGGLYFIRFYNYVDRINLNVLYPIRGQIEF